MKGVAVFVLFVLAMAHLMVEPTQAITCGQVISSIAPCVRYLTGKEASPSLVCCSGVKNLQRMAATTADRRTACGCLKTAAASFTNLKEDAASSLPSHCGVTFNVPISKNVDCSRIS